MLLLITGAGTSAFSIVGVPSFKHCGHSYEYLTYCFIFTFAGINSSVSASEYIVYKDYIPYDTIFITYLIKLRNGGNYFHVEKK